MGAREVGGEEHQRVGTKSLSLFAALEHFGGDQRRGLADQFTASVDAPGAELVKLIAFLLGQVGMLSCAGTKHQPMDAGVDIEVD